MNRMSVLSISKLLLMLLSHITCQLHSWCSLVRQLSHYLSLKQTKRVVVAKLAIYPTCQKAFWGNVTQQEHGQHLEVTVGNMETVISQWQLNTLVCNQWKKIITRTPSLTCRSKAHATTISPKGYSMYLGV